MTKKAGLPLPILPVRTKKPEVPSPETSRAKVEATNHSLIRTTPSWQGDVQTPAHQPIFHFGQNGGVPIHYDTCSPPQPILQYAGLGEVQSEDLPVEDLCSAYIAEEFEAWAVYRDLPGAFAHTATIDAVPTPLDQSWTGSDIHSPQVPVWPPIQVFTPNLDENLAMNGWQPRPPPYTLNSANAGPPIRPASTGRILLPRLPGPPAAPPDMSGADDQPNGQRRKRPMSPMARDSARRVRLVGACARCHAMKEKCDLKRPCGKCLGKAKRTLDFFCMTELPETRHEHLFTDDMYGHLDLKGGKFFAPPKMPKPAEDQENIPFLLRLHQYFDDPELIVPVLRFKPTRPVDTKKSIFPIAETSHGYEVHAQEITSPPLVPALNQNNLILYINRFRVWVRRWLECAEYHDDLNWHETFFRVEHGKAWPRAVLSEVCQFHHKVTLGRCPALKNALQSTVLAYMLGHSFYVPHEDIGMVINKSGLDIKYDGTFRFVSPVHVDRFLKALLFQFFKAIARTAFKYYQDLCSPNKFSKLARDRILATSIVLLIVAASQQSKAVEKAVARSKRGQEMDKNKVYAYIQEVEQYINDLLIQIWEYKFQDCSKWEQEVPQERVRAHAARSFNLLGRFEATYAPHGTYPFAPKYSRFLTSLSSITGSSVD